MMSIFFLSVTYAIDALQCILSQICSLPVVNLGYFNWFYDFSFTGCEMREENNIFFH